MSGGTKVIIGAIIAVVALFAWIAIDLRSDRTHNDLPQTASSGRRVEPRNQPAAGSERVRGGRHDSTNNDHPASAPRPIPKQQRAETRSGASRAPDRIAKAVRKPDPAPNQPNQGNEAAAAGNQRQRGNTGGSLEPQRGDQHTGSESGKPPSAGRADSAEQAKDQGAEAPPQRYVPAPGDLKPFADLSNSELSKREMDGLDLEGADFTDAKLAQATLRDSDLAGAIFQNADLTRADLRRAIVTTADFSGAQLSQADFRGSDMSGTNLSDSNLNRSNFGGVAFTNADLSGADLRDAVLFGTDFRGANLEGADFENADLREANLGDADLNGALNLTCDQITQARLWEDSFRPEELACGGVLRQ